MKAEMLSFFEPRYRYFAKWWIQLFAESEGKDGKGLYPVSAQCSEDLHSIGQFVQDGTHMIFETFLDVKNQDASYVLEKDQVDDRFDYLNGVDFWEINKGVLKQTGKPIPSVFHVSKYRSNRLMNTALDSYFISLNLPAIFPACFWELIPLISQE